MAKINSCKTYGLFENTKVVMSALTGSAKTASFKAELSGAAPAALIIDIPHDSVGDHVLTFKSTDGRADKAVPLSVGELNVIMLDSKSIKKPDGTAEFTITTTSATVTSVGATACLICHAAVKNN